jgi:hypothetical protein
VLFLLFRSGQNFIVTGYAYYSPLIFFRFQNPLVLQVEKTPIAVMICNTKAANPTRSG